MMNNRPSHHNYKRTHPPAAGSAGSGDGSGSSDAKRIKVIDPCDSEELLEDNLDDLLTQVLEEFNHSTNRSASSNGAPRSTTTQAQGPQTTTTTIYRQPTKSVPKMVPSQQVKAPTIDASTAHIWATSHNKRTNRKPPTRNLETLPKPLEPIQGPSLSQMTMVSSIPETIRADTPFLSYQSFINTESSQRQKRVRKDDAKFRSFMDLVMKALDKWELGAGHVEDAPGDDSTSPPDRQAVGMEEVHRETKKLERLFPAMNAVRASL